MTLTEAFLQVFETLKEVKEKTGTALRLSEEGIASLAQTLYNNSQKDTRTEKINNERRPSPPKPPLAATGEQAPSSQVPSNTRLTGAPRPNGNGKASKPQLNLVWRLIKEKGMKADEISKTYGCKVNDLTFAQAKEVIDDLKAREQEA